MVLINLGYGLDNDLLGRCQVQLIFMDTESCQLRVANLDGSAEATVSVPWNPDGPHGYVSLLEQAARDLEPPSDTWELLLTQYSELLEGDFPYQVTGILTPNQRVTVYDYSDYSWDEALARDWSADGFTTDWNAIGYDWKYFDLNEGVYSIDPNRIFGVRTSEGREFQLRILDFYDEIGNKDTSSWRASSADARLMCAEQTNFPSVPQPCSTTVRKSTSFGSNGTCASVTTPHWPKHCARAGVYFCRIRMSHKALHTRQRATAI